MARLSDLPPELHVKIVYRLLDDYLHPAFFLNPYEFVLQLCQTSSYWREVMLVGIEQCQRDIELYIERDLAVYKTLWLPPASLEKHRVWSNDRVTQILAELRQMAQGGE